jgi:hypothetical protein
MKEVIVYSNYGNKIALVDDEDFDKVNQYRWNLNCEYAWSKIDNRNIRMHHFVYKKPEKRHVIDHYNNNSLDNRKENLNMVSWSVNSQNRKKEKFQGASEVKDKNGNVIKYHVRFKGTHIGYFEDFEEAVRQYDYYIINNCDIGYKLNFQYTNEEKENIKRSDLAFKKHVKKDENLPKNIYFEKGKYRCKIQRENIKVDEYFDTLIEAIEKKEEVLEEHEEKKEIKNKSQDITYLIINGEWIACIEIVSKEEKFYCLVDEDKWHDLNKISWWRSHQYASAHKGKSSTPMHRYIWEKWVGYTDLDIDHKNRITFYNGNIIDNRLDNLREATESDNAHNKTSTNINGHIGISFDKRNNSYVGRISKNYVLHSTKYYKNKEDAIKEYLELEKKLYPILDDIENKA